MSKKRRRSMPSMLFWSRTEQRRFIDAVEKLVATVNDLSAFLSEAKRRRRPRPEAHQAPPVNV